MAVSAEALEKMAVSSEAVIKEGTRVRIHGLKSKPEYNQSESTVLGYDKKKERWRVELDDDLEKWPVVIKPENLSVLHADLDAGVFVKVKGENGETIVMDPGRLKDEFSRIVSQYNLERFSDRIADFLTAEEKVTITPQELGAEFGIPDQEAGVFLAWVNIAMQFKSECMT